MQRGDVDAGPPHSDIEGERRRSAAGALRALPPAAAAGHLRRGAPPSQAGEEPLRGRRRAAEIHGQSGGGARRARGSGLEESDSDRHAQNGRRGPPPAVRQLCCTPHRRLPGAGRPWPCRSAQEHAQGILAAGGEQAQLPRRRRRPARPVIHRGLERSNEQGRCGHGRRRTAEHVQRLSLSCAKGRIRRAGGVGGLQARPPPGILGRGGEQAALPRRHCSTDGPVQALRLEQGLDGGRAAARRRGAANVLPQLLGRAQGHLRRRVLPGGVGGGRMQARNAAQLLAAGGERAGVRGEGAVRTRRGCQGGLVPRLLRAAGAARRWQPPQAHASGRHAAARLPRRGVGRRPLLECSQEVHPAPAAAHHPGRLPLLRIRGSPLLSRRPRRPFAAVFRRAGRVRPRPQHCFRVQWRAPLRGNLTLRSSGRLPEQRHAEG
mmetsp:Transcript_21913/g.85866  ORF Transcript_21913/g.85866 Transcript_21913/m.85866 type:complete len:434 (+) Transcript_21913:259-1560(+)